MEENKVVSGVQIARTTPYTLVVKGDFSYNINFFTDENGIAAKVTTNSGDNINMGDQIIFLDLVSNVQRIFKFVELGEIIKIGSIPYFQNVFRLDIENMNWLAQSQIGYVYMINTALRERRRMTVNETEKMNSRK